MNSPLFSSSCSNSLYLRIFICQSEETLLKIIEKFKIIFGDDGRMKKKCRLNKSIRKISKRSWIEVLLIASSVLVISGIYGAFGSFGAIQMEALPSAGSLHALPTSSPPWSSNPPDAAYNRTTTAVISWTLYDYEMSGGNYQVLKNGTPYTTWMSWTNETSFNVTIDTSTLGVWNYTIQYNDTMGIWGTPNMVFITIISTETNDEIPGFLFFFGLPVLIALAMNKHRRKSISN